MALRPSKNFFFGKLLRFDTSSGNYKLKTENRPPPDPNVASGTVDSAAVTGIITSTDHHPTISAASSSNNSGNTFIQDVLVDGNGHVTTLRTASPTSSAPSWLSAGSNVDGATDAVTSYALAIGQSALAKDYTTTIGGVAGGTTDAKWSVHVGYLAHSDNGDYNVAVGYNASANNLYSSNGSYATTIGANATAGNQGTALGGSSSAGPTGSICIGTFTSCGSGNSPIAFGTSASASGQDAVAIGRSSSASAYQFVLGNTSTNDLRCQDTSISAVSDSRDKTQIETLSIGLDFVKAIEPKAFYKNNRGHYYTHKYTPQDLLDDSNLSQISIFDSDGYNAATHKFDKREFGFISQDVAAQLPAEYSDARVSFNQVDTMHGYDVQHFTMGDMTPILWKALRELSDKYDALESDHTALKARVAALENA